MPKPEGTLMLKRSELASLVELKDYIQAVETAFKLFFYSAWDS